MSFTEHAIGVLRERGYKVTRPRKQVLEAIERAEGPMSPYDIGKMMQGRAGTWTRSPSTASSICCVP